LDGEPAENPPNNTPWMAIHHVVQDVRVEVIQLIRSELLGHGFVHDRKPGRILAVGVGKFTTACQHKTFVFRLISHWKGLVCLMLLRRALSPDWLTAVGRQLVPL